MLQARKPLPHLINAESVSAYLATEVGRATLRRELVECGGVKSGQQVLILYDEQAPDGSDQLVRLAAEMLRELGAKVVLMQTDALLPLSRGGMPGSFARVEKHRIPRPVYDAILAADVTFDYTASGRGAQKYNVDFYTLGSYYGKRITGRRAVESPEVLSSEAGPLVPNAAALTFPSDLLRVIGARVAAVLQGAAAERRAFRLTNPWGTDLRYTCFPADITRGSTRKHPSDDVFVEGDRLYLAVAGPTIVQSCEGVWVTRFCTLLGGALAEPIRVTFEDGFLADVEGPDAPLLLDQLVGERYGIHAILVGYNPKAAPFREGRYILGNDGAAMGTSHIGMGAPGLFFRSGAWGPVGSKHFQLGNIPKVSLWAGDEPVWVNGVLRMLDDPVVREAARQYGDPDEVLRPFAWPAGSCEATYEQTLLAAGGGP
jgi:hypothetical protein